MCTAHVFEKDKKVIRGTDSQLIKHQEGFSKLILYILPL